MNQPLIAIDPGKDGGFAFHSDGETTAYRMPKTPKEIWLLLAGRDPAAIFIEKVHSSPQMGVKSSFTLGRGVGGLEMAAIAAGLDIQYVTPHRWQKEFGLITKGRKIGDSSTDKKNAHKSLAQELFPELKITHAIADALLICEYGRRVLAKELTT